MDLGSDICIFCILYGLRSKTERNKGGDLRFLTVLEPKVSGFASCSAGNRDVSFDRSIGMGQDQSSALGESPSSSSSLPSFLANKAKGGRTLSF